MHVFYFKNKNYINKLSTNRKGKKITYLYEYYNISISKNYYTYIIRKYYSCKV